MDQTVTSSFFGDFISNAVITTAHFWLPIILAYMFWELWVHYIHERWIEHSQWTTLEIKIPREIMKSPKAMEVVLNGIYMTKDGSNLKELYWDGWLRAWFSLEIVSIGGNVRFFVQTPKPLKGLVKTQFYGQYPEIEIHEVEDYTKEIVVGHHLNPDYKMDGMEFILEKPDIYPIKTYIDHGLDKAAEEEEKTDPITSLIEFMGSIGPGEQLWFQVLVRATKKKKEWEAQAKAEIDKLMKRDQVKSDTLSFASLLLSPGERLVVETIEKSISKLGFDTGIRFLYVSRKDKFNSVNIAAMTGVMRQFTATNLNNFKPINRAAVDYFPTFREGKIKRKMVDAYVRRSYFHPPYQRKYFILSAEELATVFHFPGAVSETPTLGRIEAKKSEPPSNLPI